MYVSVCEFMLVCVSVCMSVRVYEIVRLWDCDGVSEFVHVSVFEWVYVSVYVSVYMSVYVSVFGIVREFLFEIVC